MSIQLAVSAAGLEDAPYGHFQVVGPDGNEIEVQPSTLGAGNWVVTIRDHDGTTPNPWPIPGESHNTIGILEGVVNEAIYTSVNLPTLDGQSDAQLWQLLTNIALAIQSEQQNITYRNQGVIGENGTGVLDENGWPIVLENGTQNSNTFISTLLSVIDIDLADYVPSILQDLNFQTVPGYTHNVLFDPLNGEPISLTFTGSDGDDFIQLGNGNDTFMGGLGDDTLSGGGGADWIFDRGADALFVEGDDAEQYQTELFQYDGDGNDTINGGAGSDMLVYTGGEDTFIGGTGNDSYIVSPDFHENSPYKDPSFTACIAT